MNWRKILGVIWAVLIIPTAFIALVSLFLCDSPNGCVHSASDFIMWYIPVLIPISFIVGAVAGWLPDSTRKWSQFLLFLPIVPIILFVAYLLI